MTAETFKKAYTNTYWVQFNGRASGCITVTKDEDPILVAREFGDVREIDALPYPANPVLRRGEGSSCPEFCYSPAQCKGRTACPKSYACSE